MAKYSAWLAARRVNDKGGSLEFGLNHESLEVGCVGNLQNVRAATNLAVFDIVLAAPSGLIDDGLIPFTAARTLETRFHDDIVGSAPKGFHHRGHRVHRGNPTLCSPVVILVLLARGSGFVGGAGVRFADRVAREHKFDAAVLLAAFGRVVRGDGRRLAEAGRDN